MTTLDLVSDDVLESMLIANAHIFYVTAFFGYQDACLPNK